MNINDTTQYLTLTWNVGGDTDYIGLCRRAKIEPWDSFSDLPRIRKELFKKVFSQIFATHKPDIIFLQEVGRTEPVIRTLLDGYQIHYDGDDTLVAWREASFSEIKGSKKSQQLCQRYSIIDLKDKKTSQIIRVSSAHIHGFDLNDPDFERGSHKKTENGDEELTDITRLMLDTSKRTPDIYVIGMDANSTPDIHPERIQILDKEGFSRDKEDDSETAFNPTLPSRKAKIDFVCAKVLKGNCQVVATKACPAISIESPESNPSDHRPLFKTIIIENTNV